MASPACPARIPSNDGTPVEVVGRPSIGLALTPGIPFLAVTVLVEVSPPFGADEPDRATLRFRKAMEVFEVVTKGQFLCQEKHHRESWVVCPLPRSRFR